MYDYFVAELRCPNCGTINPTTAYTNMQTHLRGDADGSELGIGWLFDPVDLTVTHIVASGYALVATPPPMGPIRLLEVWICPACSTEQWSMIEIVDMRIHRIEAVSMNHATLEATNFISEVDADLLAAALMDISTRELSARKLNSVEILKQRLE